MASLGAAIRAALLVFGILIVGCGGSTQTSGSMAPNYMEQSRKMAASGSMASPASKGGSQASGSAKNYQDAMRKMGS
ncbi:MAG TPA: hypothetical protein VNC50_21265 [Planctomycetia bacterium]|nr:hypothetical protein [Planctomycetia bacterium]